MTHMPYQECHGRTPEAYFSNDVAIARKYIVTKPFHQKVEPVGGTCGKSPAEVGGW